MSSFEDLTTSLANVATLVTNVKGDVDTLLAKINELQSNPPTGMTPEQQASLDAAVSAANNIGSALTAIDNEVPQPQPAVDQQPAPAATTDATATTAQPADAAQPAPDTTAQPADGVYKG